MLKIVIDKKEYQMPNRIEEIQTKTGMEIDKLIQEDYQGVRSTECNKWLLSILLNTNYDEVDKVCDESVNIVINKHCYFENNRVYLAKHIILNHLIYELREFDFTKVNHEVMTVLNYDEITDMLAKPYNNYRDLFHKLYKKVSLKQQLNYKLRLTKKNYKSVDVIPWILLASAIYQHVMYRNELVSRYRMGIYDERMAVEQQDEEIKLNTIEETFGLYHQIMTVANQDIERFIWWLDKDIEFFLKYAHYLQLLSAHNKES